MRNTHLLLASLLALQLSAFAQEATVLNPNNIQFSPIQHKDLPQALLKRIHATTDVFEKIDGITYERAVDLYKRDVNPEENLVLWEEMARAYTTFCKNRCSTAAEKMDVYRALLLRTMFDEQEATLRTQPKVLSTADVKSVVELYRLPPKPIDVVKAK